MQRICFTDSSRKCITSQAVIHKAFGHWWTALNYKTNYRPSYTRASSMVIVCECVPSSSITRTGLQIVRAVYSSTNRENKGTADPFARENWDSFWRLFKKLYKQRRRQKR
jgi:hypothetical protein